MPDDLLERLRRFVDAAAFELRGEHRAVARIGRERARQFDALQRREGQPRGRGIRHRAQPEEIDQRIGIRTARRLLAKWTS